MYDELVKRLRDCTSDTVEDCAGCPYQGGYKGTYCMNGLITEASDAIEELSRAQEQWIEQERNVLLKSIPRWIPVTEQLPQEIGTYLVFVANVFQKSIAVTTTAVWEGQNFIVGDFVTVTHWMPLPEPPGRIRHGTRRLPLVALPSLRMERTGTGERNGGDTMSLFIFSMTIPKEGYVDVRLFSDGRATTQTGTPPFYREMPIIEIPEEHGRLIDADCIEMYMFSEWMNNNLSNSDWILFRERLNEVPTVIPEGKEET